MSLPINVHDEFPGRRSLTYLDTAARGLLPARSRQAAEAFLELRVLGTARKDDMFACVERCRSTFANLINCSPDEIAITKNVSEGVNTVAAALRLEAGANVVVCPSLEHPANIFPWYNLARLNGVEVREVDAPGGRLDAARMIAAMDHRTKAMAVSEVSFSPGLRSDLGALSAACRTRDVFLLVDGAQSVGMMHTDVEAEGFDGLAVSTQKGLLGAYGMGFLYVRRAWAERMRPVYLSRFGVDLGKSNEAARGAADAPLAPGARRFDVGNYNYESAVIVDASLSLIRQIGTRAIEAHIVSLSHALARGLISLQLPVAGGEPGRHIGPIVCVGRHGAGGHDTTDDPELASLHSALTDAGVRLSVRQGMLRFSFHLFNTATDVERVLDIVRGWQVKTARLANASLPQRAM